MKHLKKEKKNLYLADCKMVQDTIEEHVGFAIDEDTRVRQVVDARKIYYKICRDNIFGVSFQMLADTMNQNHATVMVNLNRLNDYIDYDQKLLDLYLNLEGICLEKIQNLKNPFHKYLGKEDHFQNQVMTYLKAVYPRVFAIHVPNEGKRSPFERYKFKFLGGVPGVPDVLIFHQKDDKSGLAIELKVGSNKPTENQIKCLNKLKGNGWETIWSNDFDEVKSEIDKYLKK